MNKGFFIGNLTRDPETRTTQSGIAMCRFGLAVNRRRGRSDPNRPAGQPDVDFFNVICFRQLAELAQKYLAKGRKISVLGAVQINTYEGQDGVKRTSVDIVADDIEFLPSANQAGGPPPDAQYGGGGGYAPPGAAGAPKPAADFTEVDEDDLPF